MRIDLRRSGFLTIGLVVSGAVFSSGLLAAPASASARPGPAAYHGRTVDREAIARNRIVRQPRVARSGGRSGARFPAGDDIWRRLRRCEAGGRYNVNSGNGYYGA